MPDSEQPDTGKRELRRGLVIGCGGTLGFAWIAVTLAALERELGWDARTADVLVGTSAGSEMVSLLGSGRPSGAILDALTGGQSDPLIAHHLAQHPGMIPPLPSPRWPALGMVRGPLSRRADLAAGLTALLPRGRGDAGWLKEFGTALADEGGWLPHPNTWLVAADVADGRRVAFGSPSAPKATLAEAIAASWGIPGWFPPVTIAGRSYQDGGAVSTASVDLCKVGAWTRCTS